MAKLKKEYEVFANELKEELKKILPEALSMEVLNEPIDNGYESVIFRKKEEKPSDVSVNPCFKLSNDFCMENYEKGSSAFAKELMEIIEKTFSDISTTPLNIEDVLYKAENIFPSLIEKEGNEDVLKNAPHRVFFDMAVCYRVEFDYGSCLISNPMLQGKNFPLSTEEELFACAKENISHKQLLTRYIEGVPVSFCLGEPKFYGANFLLCENHMEFIAHRLGVEKFYISPVSTHECIFMLDWDKELEILHHEMVKECQKNIRQDHILPGSVFCWDNVKKELVMEKEGF